MLTGPARPPWKHFDAMWFHYGPALIASILLLPLIVVDIVRMSNRFVGPLVRLRRSMRQLAQGEHVEPITFRDDDFWKEFADEFNAVLARVQGGDPDTTTEPDHHEKNEPVGVGME
jgi:signal transduction histidine kinase